MRGLDWKSGRLENSSPRHPQSSGADDMTKRFSMNVEGKRKEHIDDLAIAESTLPEEGRKKPSFVEKTRFQCEIGDLRFED